MPLWDKFKQGTRETFGADKTNLPGDVVELVARGEAIKKSYDTLVSKSEKFITPDIAKRITDKIGSGSKDSASKLPIYSLGKALKEAGLESQYRGDIGSAYTQCGDTVMSLGEIQAEFETQIHDRFISPKEKFLKQDIKEGFEHYDKLKSRRLDYDAKKRKMKDASLDKEERYNQELTVAQNKMDESIGAVREYFTYLCEDGAQDGSQYAELMGAMQAMLEYHQNSYTVLNQLNDRLQFSKHMQRQTPRIKPAIQYNKGWAASASAAAYASNSTPPLSPSYPASPPPETAPPAYSSSGTSSPTPAATHYGGIATPIANDVKTTKAMGARAVPPPPPPPPRRLRCRALYEFQAVQQGDLQLKEGDVIEVTSQDGGDWWEGIVNGQKGIFPANYVQPL